MKILIVKTSALGDIIHAFSAITYLKALYPQVEIDWVVEESNADLLKAHPLISRIFCINTKKWRRALLKRETWLEIKKFRKQLRSSTYDLVIDLQGNVKSGLITFNAISAFKAGFGYASVAEWPNLIATHKHYNPPDGGDIREDYQFVAESAIRAWQKPNLVEKFVPEVAKEAGLKLNLSNEEKQEFNSCLKKIPPDEKLKLMVCPGSNWPNKQVSPNVLALFLSLLASELKVQFLFIWGNATEKKVCLELAAKFSESIIFERLSLPTLQNLMSVVDLVLAMDSLPLHLAATTSTPTYSIFGASSAFKYKPVGDKHHAFQGTCPYDFTFKKRCDKLRTCSTGACIKDLDGRKLFQDFLLWWFKLKEETV